MSGLEITENDLKTRLNNLLTLAQSSKAWSRVYPLYQKLQTDRFMSENASEGESWPSLNSEYAQYKLKRYGGGLITRGKRKDSHWGSYPGEGRKMLIGTLS